MERIMFMAVALILSLGADARVSELTREYVSPVRIMWTQGDVQNADALLGGNIGQSVFGAGKVCQFRSTSSQQSSILLDYGKEFQGGLQIVCDQYPGGKPVRVRIRFGESVSEAMSEVSVESGATNDHAVRDFEATLPWFGTREFGNSGFRFVRLDVLDTGVVYKINEINGIKEYRDIEYIGSFKSDNQRLDDIWMTGAYTVHQNMQNYIWDGIKRDRLVWIGDMHPEVMCVNSVFGNQKVVEKSLDLARDCAPLPSMMNGMSAYSLWWMIIQRDWYLYQGDMDYLLEQKDYMKGLTDVLISKIDASGRDTIEDHFLDWPSRSDSKASGTGFHALFIMAMEAQKEVFSLLDEADYADKCSKAIKALRAAAPAVAREFFAQGIKASDYGRKQAVSLMYLADMIPASQASEALLTDGAIGFSTFYGYYMLEALSKCGKYREALDIASQFWGGMLDLGATTFWEDFDVRWLDNAARIDEFTPEGKTDVHLTYGGYCYKKLRHSFCHGWASGPTSWMTGHILGLYPVEYGSRTVRVEPHLVDMNTLEGSLPTPYGPVKVRLQKIDGNKIRAEVSAPEQVNIQAADYVTLVKTTAF